MLPEPAKKPALVQCLQQASGRHPPIESQASSSLVNLTCLLQVGLENVLDPVQETQVALSGLGSRL